MSENIRAVALSVIKNQNGQILLEPAYDTTKEEKFYRPLGGGIEMGETGSACIKREVMEELGVNVTTGERLCVIENIFTYEGQPGHQIMLVYPCTFTDFALYNQEELPLIEQENRTAVWRSPAEIEAEGAVLHPGEITNYL